MAIREGFDFSGVTLLTGEKPEERVTEGSPLESVTILGKEEEPIEGPVMKAFDAPWYEDIRDFASGVHDHLAHGDSFSMLHNFWKSTFQPQEAVPEYDEEGNLIGVRKETSEELTARIPKHRELIKKQYGLDDDSAEALTAKVASIFIDPTTYSPMGQTYKGVALTTGALTGIDVAAYNLATEGEIDPADVAIATSLGTIFGPAFKYAGGKLVDMYKGFRSRGIPHEETIAEMQKALPAPETFLKLPAPEPKALPAPQKKLPSPEKTAAPRFISQEGVDVGAVQGAVPHRKTVIRDGEVPKVGKAQQEEAMWSARQDLGETSLTEKVGGALPNKKVNAMTAAFSRAQKNADEGVEKVINHMNQGGGISQPLLYHMASTGIGATVGGAVDGPEGAAYGALAGLGAPSVWRHVISKPIGKLSKWASHDAAGHFAMGKFASSPTATLKSWGPTGRIIANQIERLHENIDLSVAGKIFDLEKTVGHLTKGEMVNVRRLLNHTTRQGTKHEVAAAKQLRREFNQILDDAVAANVMTKATATSLKANAAKNGYFPRMYDIDLLSSAKGKEAWVKAWTEFSGSNRDLKAALESIVGDKDIVAKMVAKSKGKLTRAQALDLMRMMRNRGQNNRSVHLEHSRKISEEAESILEPFLIKDTNHALMRYYNDVYRRIEASKMFGGFDAKGKWNHDLKAEHMIERLGREHGDETERMAREVFLSSVGDQSSDMAQKYMKLGELEGKILRGLGGFETGAKLGLAQTANMMQATVNGMTRLANVTGNPFTTVRLQVKGMVKGLGKEGGEFSDRVGAALETTLMEAAGEGSKLNKFGTGVLRGTGFIAAERLQRRLGANIGRVYAEELAEKAIRIQSGALKGHKAAKVKLQMKELGLPTNRPITQTDIDRAGLRFSNDINFRNTPDKLPLAWQTPYGRLFTKFKSFAFHQSRFVKNNVIKPLISKGNPWPLVWYTTGASGIGMGVDEIRRLIKGDDRELSETERYLRGITMIGGMGILQDTLTQFHRGPEKGLANLAGPAPADIARGISGTIGAIEEQDPKVLLEEITRSFVVPGQKVIIDEISAEGRKRGGRSSGRSSGGSRGSGR